MTTSNGGVWRHVAHRLGGGVCRFHRCQRGQAIFVVVLFFFLLAGLLFLVLNSGEKLNHKVMMQGAADSATTTGAAWFARGLNTISMCNVAETQLLSLIVLLDTLETVIPVAKDNIDAYVKDYQNVPNDARVDDWLVVGDALEEQKIIHELYQIAYRGDSRWFPEYCNYDTGVMWECIKLMDGFSHSMEQVTPLAAQREAMQIAKKNHAEFGFVLPLWPELPVVDGQFNDFRDPMVSARMPQAYGHELIGGFAWVMNYRGYRNQVMGPWSWWREPFVSAPPLGLFDLSGLSTLFRLVSQRKLDMLFGSGDSKICLREWEYDYDKAKGLPRNEIIRAWWDRTSFDARYPYPQDSFFSNMDLRHEKTPPVSTSAYPSMDRPNLAGYTRSSRSWEGADGARNVWYRVTERQTAHYPELGIFAPHPPVYPDGSPWPYTASEMKTYYHVQFYRFQGAEKGLDMDLHREYLPPVGSPPNLGPIFFTQEGDNYTANVNDHFTFNGFAYRSGKVREWTDRFTNPNPSEELVAYAQARVYNRWSWDLFTQHWKVKLMKADRWSVLDAEMSKGIPGEGSAIAGELTPERFEPVRRMLGAYSDTFVQEVSH